MRRRLLWFVVLYVAGLATVAALAYALRLIWLVAAAEPAL